MEGITEKVILVKKNQKSGLKITVKG